MKAHKLVHLRAIGNEPKDIQYLQDHGFFSGLDIHFASLMTRLSGKGDEDVFLAAALVSRATGEGHVCLDLSAVEGRPLITDESGTDGFVCPRLDGVAQET